MNLLPGVLRLFADVRFLLAVAFLAGGLNRQSWGQFVSIELEQPPLSYSETPPRNRVSRLIEAMERGDVTLERDPERGFLPSLLRQLEISESSQVLVFSKTSLQVQHISPRNPRAVYFNDDTYVGWVPGGSLIEISTNDPKLGAAFYTVRASLRRPNFRLETYQCLGCHATTMTRGVPGHTVRSGYPDYDGKLDAQKESFVTDDTSDFRERWGGWYVTGSHGDLRHMGNAFLRGGDLDTTAGANRETLGDLFNVRQYLTPDSDIQALMVLEHQTQMHNAFTLADFSARVLGYEYPDQDEAERAVQLRLIAKAVVDRLLFRNEFPLTSPISGTSRFREDFELLGPRDADGRSLREFDMRSRMFRYPLSYLIHSEAFDALQPVLRAEIGRQLQAILERGEQADEFRHLTPELRKELTEIIHATKPDLFR